MCDHNPRTMRVNEISVKVRGDIGDQVRGSDERERTEGITP